MSASWWSTLRSRLIASYVAALVLALAAFGAVAVVVIDRDLHASLDARLRTTAAAARNFVDLKQSVVQVDERDRAQLYALLGSQINIAVLSGASGVVLSSTPTPSAKLLAQARSSDGFATLSYGGDEVRALVLPIMSGSRRVGAVVAWASTEWIETTDRQVAVAFAIAALLLAAVASLAGSSLASRALEDTFQRQRRFTTDAAHELRAPLSVIRAEADLALRKPREALAYQAALTTIASEAEQMEHLVSALLAAARAQDSKGAHTVVDPVAIAAGVCTRLRSTAEVKHISIDVARGDLSARGDADALERAITAVLHNAIKHTPAGGTIRVWAGRRSGNCELYVRDSGPGFSSEALAHGLEWFWRGETGRSDDHATGLGLAIASSIARANGGGITLANAPEGGALVTISLPEH